MMVYRILFAEEGETVLFESGEKSDRIGRFSHIGSDPVAEIRSHGSESRIREGKHVRTEGGDPLTHLRALHKKYRAVSSRSSVGFAGGCAGYVAYDAVRYREKIPDSHSDGGKLPDLFFRFFDTSITFDHIRESMLIVRVKEFGGDPNEVYEKGMDEINTLYGKIRDGGGGIGKGGYGVRSRSESSFRPISSPDDTGFREKVARAREYIKSGDVFQVVLSRSFTTPVSVSPFTIYRSVRLVSPAPYMFFIRTGDFALVGASPEKSVSLQGTVLETIPLAGTRPRGETPEEDVAMERELLGDPKEVAEHMMLVDLGRNDLGRVSTMGSVTVGDLKTVQRFSHVMHIASFVRGEIAEGFDAIDALMATFPAGTLSGAPKIRAMEIIDELETDRRGPYGGTVCFIDHAGNLESCIAIRMAVISEGKAVVRAGTGIVYDSDPEREAEETRHKAKGILEAIRLAEEGEMD